MNYERLQQMYATDEYYWGKEPNSLALRSLEFLTRNPGNSGLRAVDLGAGEGRDAVLFAGRGLDTLAVDIAPNGLEKATRLAREKDVEIRVEQGDINTLRLRETFDLIYSIGTIQYLIPTNRRNRFEHLQAHTAPGGLHALFAFTDHPDVPPAPDWGPNEYLYSPGELPRYYPGWQCLYSRSFVFDDDSEGVLHRHAAEEYIFEKPRGRHYVAT